MRPIRRREFLRLTIVTAVSALPAIGCADGDEVLPGTQESDRFFPQSIASGDPRPSSVILWTRVEDTERADRDLSLELEVAKDSGFTQRVTLQAASPVVAEARFAHCVKVKVEGLEPATTYYYRFVYRRDDEVFTSRTGRTKTAPLPDADVPVRFAVVSCQDFNGKYFHVYKHLIEQDIDFFVHLGDYVYETVGDPTFQAPTEERKVTFRDSSSALSLGEGSDNLAAQSLDNYRDLYRAYRSDPDLKRAHELFPMVAIWDDHEFSDDCYGDTATYFDGSRDEKSPERRTNADQAWFEFMPVDYVDSAVAYDPAKAFPENISIYRALEFGKHVHLVLTDLRRYRADHVIPENAFPGSVALTQAELQAELGTLPTDAVPYVDIDSFESGSYRDFLRANAGAFTPARIAGLISAEWINARLAALSAIAGVPAAIDLARTDLERGYAYHQLMKNTEFSSMGSRYLVRQNVFRTLANVRFKASNGESEQVLGAAQEAWFLNTMRSSAKTWKIWGNEFTFMQRMIDLTTLAIAPPEFQTKILITCEDWDGFPNRREALLKELAPLKNVVLVTGDLHAFFAGTPFSETDPTERVVEFVIGSVSSTTWQTGLSSAVQADPTIPPAAAALALAVGDLLQSPTARPNPHIGYLDLAQNGYAIVRAGAELCEATLFVLADTKVRSATLDGEISTHFEPHEFRVMSGSPDLYGNIAGEWKRWNMETAQWVSL